MDKLREAARQALGALVRAEALYGQPNADIQTALWEALAEQAEQEPVAWMFCLDGCNQVVLDEDSDSVIRHNGTPLVPAPVQPVKQEEANLPVVRWLWADKYGNITNRMYTESEAKEQIASAIKLEWSRTEFPE